jgi:hypothetical protein
LTAAGIVVHAATAGERLRLVVASVGGLGCVLTALAVPRRWTSLLPLGLFCIGASYGMHLALHEGSVDAAAPLVAGALFLAAELAYWSLERGAPSRRGATVRRAGGVALGALLTALVGSLVLVAASGVSGGVALEALGVLAALLTLGAVALLASRASV